MVDICVTTCPRILESNAIAGVPVVTLEQQNQAKQSGFRSTGEDCSYPNYTCGGCFDDKIPTCYLKRGVER